MFVSTAGVPQSGDASMSVHASAAVTDLLGVLAYGELTTFCRLAADADEAPTLGVKTALAALAVGEHRQYVALTDRMRQIGVDPEAAMGPFVAAFDAYHLRTRPNTWLEGVVKAVVGEGIAKDFYREMSGLVDEQTRQVMLVALDDHGEVAALHGIIRSALAVDPTAPSRLSLWGRRLMGEALSQAQAVAAERDSLSGLLIGGGLDLGEVGAMFMRLKVRHEQRMVALGLDP